jgi:LPXTG-motif cell wall-anchored protein
MSPTRSFAATAALGFAVMVSLPAVASAATSPYQPDVPLCTVGGSAVVDAKAAPNSSVTLAISNAGASVPIAVTGAGSAVVSTAQGTSNAAGAASLPESVGSTGSATFTVTTPSGTGTCAVTVLSNGVASPSVQPPATSAVPVTTSGGSSTPGASLPNTGGGDVFPLTIGGIALVATGIGMVAATRTRRRSTR